MAGALPLSGRRVAVTRPADQSGPLVAALRGQGAEVLEAPAIEVAPPSDPGPLARSVERLGEFAWVILTSPNAVRSLLAALTGSGRGPEALGALRVAAVGRATAAVLEAAGVVVEFVPEDESADGLVTALEAGAFGDGAFLIPRAAKGREAFVAAARDRGHRVEVVEAYRTVARPEAGREIEGALAAGGLDAVVFASPSQVAAVLAGLGSGLGRLVDVVCVAIGRTTAGALEEAGLTPVVAARPDVSSLVRAVVAALATRPPGS